MLHNGLAQLSNRNYVIEIFSDSLEAMILLNQKEKARKLLFFLQNYIEKDEAKPLLRLCELNIQYSRQFGIPEDCRVCYQEYYNLYLNVQDQIVQLKADGLRAGVELNDAFRQCEQSRKELDELYDLVNYDGLTKAYNRHYFNIRLEEMLNSTEYLNIGFVMIDVDYFKEYNDHYGHAAGDEVLKLVASCLKKYTGDHMIAARYGGDEFVCLSWDVDEEYLSAYVKSVSAALKEMAVEHRKSRCSNRRRVSSKRETLALLDEVDEALYDAKSNGRNSEISIMDRRPVNGGT